MKEGKGRQHRAATTASPAFDLSTELQEVVVQLDQDDHYQLSITTATLAMLSQRAAQSEDAILQSALAKLLPLLKHQNNIVQVRSRCFSVSPTQRGTRLFAPCKATQCLRGLCKERRVSSNHCGMQRNTCTAFSSVCQVSENCWKRAVDSEAVRFAVSKK
jgi:hypothetical protein